MNNKSLSNNKKIQNEIIELKKTILNLSFQKFTGQLEKTSQIKNSRRKIARLKTKLSTEKGKTNA